MNYLYLLLLVLLQFNTLAQEIWTLPKCMEVGIENNLNVDRQVLNNQTNYINRQQYKANRLPSVNGSATQAFNFGRSIDPTSNLFVQQTIKSNNFAANASLILFNGFQNSNNIRQTKELFESGKLDIEKAKNDIRLSIASQYLQISLNTKQLEAAKIQVKTNEELIINQQKLVNAGVQNEANFAAAKAELANAQYQLILIENQVNLGELNMCQLLQIPYDENFQIVPIDLSNTIIESDSALTSKQVYLESREQMPQIKSAMLKIKSSQTALRAAKGNHYPRLTMNFGVQTLYSSQNYEISGITYQQSATPIGFVNNDPSLGVYSISPVVSRERTPFRNQLSDNVSEFVNFQLIVPIFTQKQIWAGEERAKLNIKLAENTQKQTENTLRQDVETAVTNSKAAEARFTFARISLESKKLSYEMAKKRFDAGATSLYDFIRIQSIYQQAELDLIQARYEFYFRNKTIDFYKGNVDFMKD